jgi:hypothetical protein
VSLQGKMKVLQVDHEPLRQMYARLFIDWTVTAVPVVEFDPCIEGHCPGKTCLDLALP